MKKDNSLLKNLILLLTIPLFFAIFIPMVRASDTEFVDSSCLGSSCHTSNLHDQHTKVECTTCHSSENSAVKAAIVFRQLYCSGCHTKAHTTSLNYPTPAQIPIYPGYNWSSPEPTSIWNGEPWIPYTYADNGMVFFSNQRTDVIKDDIKDWYKEQLLNAGWTIDGSMIYEEPTYFKIFAKKDKKMKIHIWCYGDSTNGWAIRTFYRKY